MDVLVQHCLRELAFDGDFGCDVPRLTNFVRDFFVANVSVIQNQRIDDAYIAFIWSILVQQANVVVGVLPPNSESEVWIAPRPHPRTTTKTKKEAKGKSKETTQEIPNEREDGATLDNVRARLILLEEEARYEPLDHLIAVHGSNLHIAVDSETSFAAVNGTHIRSPKLTPMVYTALQLVTRTRDEGLSVVDLGKKTGYDQKICFYLVKQLVDLDLVVKLRKGGISTNFCIHKYFFERSPLWSQIKEEEARSKVSSMHQPEAPFTIVQPPATEAEATELDSILLPSSVTGASGSTQVNEVVHFDPIDSRHMASLELVRGRLVQLLLHSNNHLHVAQNLITALGFSNPTKTDRRFFSNRLRDLMEEGIVEKVYVASQTSSGKVACIRLVSSNERLGTQSDTHEASNNAEPADMDTNSEESVKFTLSFPRQLVELLIERGTTGMTLGELALSTGQMDKRTVELALSRLQRNGPPPNLLDLRVIGVMENFGRERRHRYYTLSSFLQVTSREHLEHNDPDVVPLDESVVGDFLTLNSCDFFDDLNALIRVQDDLDPARAGGHRPAKSSKPQVKRYKNPLLPDGTVKRGRPRKDPNSTPRPRRKKGASSAKSVAKSTSGKPAAGSRHTPTDHLRGNSADVHQPTSSLLPDRTLNSDGRSQQMAQPKKPSKRRLDLSSGDDADEGRVTKKARREIKGKGYGPRKRLPENSFASANRDDAMDEAHDLPMCEANAAVPVDDPLAHEPPLSPLTDLDQEEASSRAQKQGDLEIEQKDGERGLLAKAAGDHDPALTLEAGGGRLNVSRTRREKEFLRVIESLGGIVHLFNKDFYDEHERLLKTLASQDEPSSTPVGIRFDKRTGDLAIRALELKGYVKVLTTSVVVNTIARPTRIAHLPNTPPEKVKQFLINLTQKTQVLASPAKKLSKSLAYTVSEGSYGHRPGQAKKRFANSPLDVEDGVNSDERDSEFIITEPQTIAQLYGYVIGRMARARKLHLYALRYLETASSRVVSTDERILDVTLLWTEIPVATYFSLVAAGVYLEPLKKLLETEEGQQLSVKDLPTDLHMALQIGRARSRARLLELLDILRCLGLVTPLVPSTTVPEIQFQMPGVYPATFKIPDNDGTPQIAPVYWRFNRKTPITRSNDGDSLVSSFLEGFAYWQDLEERSSKGNVSLSMDTPEQVATISSVDLNRTATTLNRPAAWRTAYSFSWIQRQVLQRHVDRAGADVTIVDLSQKLARLAWAPVKAVHDFLLNDVRKRSLPVSGRQKATISKADGKKVVTDLSIAQKVLAARSQREEHWRQLLSEVYNAERGQNMNQRVVLIHEHFLRAPDVQDSQKWKDELQNALTEGEGTPLPNSKPANKKPFTEYRVLPIACKTGTDELQEIESLVQAQGVVEQTQSKSKRTKEATTNPSENSVKKEAHRRNRFNWTRDFDELVKDASVIIKARVQSSGSQRIEWTALQQVFPGVKQNSVRQRISTLCQEPGCEPYLKRLQEDWSALYYAHYGTSELPDDNPSSMTDFSLAMHIAFLRRNLDKAAIRLGILHRQMDKEIGILNLPGKVDALYEAWDFVEASSGLSDWEFMWNMWVDESREKHRLLEAFTMNQEEGHTGTDSRTDAVEVAESALKMVVGTANENYDAIAASRLLASLGDTLIGDVQARLLEAGVFSKIHMSHAKPGRTLKISDANQTALGGPVSLDLFQDANALTSMIELEHDWREWPLTSTDGDTAALLQCVSEYKASFMIDTRTPRQCRELIEWNSKKTLDDHNEPRIVTSFALDVNADSDSEVSEVRSPRLVPSVNTDPSAVESHGHSISANQACRLSSFDGVIDCKSCLQDQVNLLFQGLEEGDAQIASDVVRLLVENQSGIPWAQLQDVAHQRCWDQGKLYAIVQAMCESEVPLAYWVGSADGLLLGAPHIQAWTVTVSERPLKRVFPRRWLDLKGRRIGEVWYAGLRATVGTVIFRPGISLAELRSRMQQIMNRAEMNDITSHLVCKGILQIRSRFRTPLRIPSLNALTREEEGHIYWVITSRPPGDWHWYQV